MRAVSSAASAVRHVFGALTEAILIAAIIAALLLALSPVYKPADFLAGTGTAAAAKGGKRVDSTQSGSTISLDQAASSLALGSKVTFTTSAVGLTGREYPLVYVECYSSSMGALVYGQLDGPDATFVLGGGSSKWWSVGGAADCLAHLYAYGGSTKGGLETIRELADPVRFKAGS